MPGREAIPEDDAAGRPLEVCFFERMAGAPPGETLVCRVDRTGSGMAAHTNSPAEILVALGLHVPRGPGDTAAEWEATVEGYYRTKHRLVYTHAIVAGHGDHHVYHLTEPEDAEDAFVTAAPHQDSRTRMALARLLEREQGEDAQALWRSRANTLEVLTRRALGPAAVAAPKAGARGRAGGRGRARARGGRGH